MSLPAPALRLSTRALLLLSVLWFSFNIVIAALFAIVVPTQLLLFVTPGQIGGQQQVTFLAWISTLSAIITLLVPPLVGMLSDRTRGRFGRRRPYILIGTLVLAASVPLLIRAHGILFLLLGIGVMQVGNSTLLAGYQSLMPDRVSPAQRGTASGYMGLMTILGTVGSLLLAAWLFRQVSLQTTSAAVIERGATLYYSITFIILFVGTLITLVGVHETPLTSQKVVNVTSPMKMRERFPAWFRKSWLEPWHSFNFTLVFLMRAAVMMGLTLFMTFIEYYLARVAHVTNFIQATATVAVLALLGAIVSGLFSGMLSDRVRRAPIVSAATGCMALASCAFFLLPVGFPLWPLGLLFGLGYGAYMSVDWALAIDSLPSLHEVGKDLGLWGASSTVPATLAPLLGSLIIIAVQHFASVALSYRLVFLAATLFLLLASGCVLFVREGARVRVEAPAARGA